MIKAVIFDMDGTIVDSEPIYDRVNDEIYPKYGFNLTEEDQKRHMGANLKDTWTDLLNRYSAKEKFSHYELEDFIELHVNAFYQGLADTEELTLMPGVEEWFEYLKENDYKMIIASSSYAPVIEYIYQEFELDQYMEGYVDGNSIENGKPAPDIFIKAAEKLNLEPEECIIIEDSANGVKGAERAGARVVGFNGTHNQGQDLSAADFIIEEYSRDNLKKILE